MDDDNTPNGNAQAEEDLETTPPQKKTPAADSQGGWTMPEPVFRQSSGYLPQGFEKQYGAAANPSPEVVSGQGPNKAPSAASDIAETPVQEATEAKDADIPASQSPVVEVEPQPDLLEDLVEEEELPASPPPVKKKSVLGRVLVLLLTLIIFFTLAAIFVAVVWYLLSPTPEATIN